MAIRIAPGIVRRGVPTPYVRSKASGPSKRWAVDNDAICRMDAKIGGVQLWVKDAQWAVSPPTPLPQLFAPNPNGADLP
jgi:hypothetical protein